MRHGLDVMVPSRDERDLLHDLVYRELCAGIFTRDAWSECRRVIATLEARGAECIVLASTELGLLVGREDAAVPVFDTVRVHAEAAVELALADDTAEPAPAARGLHLA